MQNNYQKIKSLTETGYSAKRISQILNINFKEVQNYIKNNNIKIINKIFSNNEISNIISLYDNGVSVKQLASIYHIDKRRIIKFLSNTKIRTKNDSHRYFNFNQHFFDKIDSEEKAYWLGFLFADGYNNPDINTFSISLNINDLDHLQKFATILSLPNNYVKIEFAKYKNKKFPSATLKLYSKHLCNTLTELGCVQNKSFVVKFPNIPEHLYIHFIKGLFDGDGCLTYFLDHNYLQFKFSITSTKEMLLSIQNIINLLDINSNLYYISKTKNNTWNLEVSGNQQILKLCNWMYNNSNIHLNRKYDKYILLKNKYEKYNYSLTTARKVYSGRYKENDGITFEEFLRISQRPCYYCGAPPSNQSNYVKKSSKIAKINGKFTYNGLDRINPNFGHSIDNVVPCCWKCNYAKRERNIIDFFVWIKNSYFVLQNKEIIK